MANSSTSTGVDPEYSVYVGNLNPSMTLSDMEDLIYELFLQAGPLDKVFIPYDKDTGKHKGYGFVEFLHKESIQYSINLMNGICLLDRYLNVRTVTQRQQSSSTPSSRNSPSLVSATTPGAAKTIIEDNPFHSQAKPLIRITLPPPPTSVTPTTTTGATSEGNPFLTPAATPGAPKVVEDNPFLTPAMPLIKVTVPLSGMPASSVATVVSQPLITPSTAQSMQCAAGTTPAPLFPSAIPQQSTPVIGDKAPLLHQAQKPKFLPLNPFLEPGYSPVPPNPFFQDLRCLPPLPPPPLELTPPFAPPPFLPPPPQQTPPLPPPLFLPPPQRTPPLAPPPPLPLFPSPPKSSDGLQSNSSLAQPVPLFPDLSSSSSQVDINSPTTVQSDELITSSIPENTQCLSFEAAHLATSFQTPPATPNGKATIQSLDCSHVDNHMSHSSSATDVNSEMDFEPAVSRDNGSWPPQFSGGDHKSLHKGRIHANDHPAWLKRETKAKLAQYHFETLALELQKLKKSTNGHQS